MEKLMIHYLGKKASAMLVLAALVSCPIFGQSRGIFIDNESNVRAGPDTKSKILLQSKTGHTFDILESSGKWYKIRLDDGTTGWTNRINLKILEDAKNPRPAVSDANKPQSTGSDEATGSVSSQAVAGSPEITRWLEASSKDPKDPVARFMLGIAYLDGNNPGQAAKEAEKLKALHGDLAKDLKKMIEWKK